MKAFVARILTLAVLLGTSAIAGAEEKKDIVDTALGAGSFKTLVAAVKAADLVDTLKGNGPFTSGRAHVESLSTSMSTVCKATRGGISRATEIGDLGTADLFTEVSRGIDKKLWFVESHLQGDQ